MMNRDEIIRMAREVADISTDSRGREEFIFDSYGVERFAALVAAAERERCAEMCEHMGIDGYGTLAIGAAIRARNG